MTGFDLISRPSGGAVQDIEDLYGNDKELAEEMFRLGASVSARMVGEKEDVKPSSFVMDYGDELGVKNNSTVVDPVRSVGSVFHFMDKSEGLNHKRAKRRDNRVDASDWSEESHEGFAEDLGAARLFSRAKDRRFQDFDLEDVENYFSRLQDSQSVRTDPVDRFELFKDNYEVLRSAFECMDNTGYRDIYAHTQFHVGDKKAGYNGVLVLKDLDLIKCAEPEDDMSHVLDVEEQDLDRIGYALESLE